MSFILKIFEINKKVVGVLIDSTHVHHYGLWSTYWLPQISLDISLKFDMQFSVHFSDFYGSQKKKH
jgi:hypothetical protein